MDVTDLSDLYRQYGSIVLRICRDILRNEQDAQDATQEAFLKFWRFAEQLRNPKEVLSNLRRTAVSCAIDALRARKRQGRYNEAWFELREILQAERESKQQGRFHNREVVSLLLQSVRVDDATLQMAYLYYLDDMTLEEVATHVGFSRRSVSMKLDKFRANALKFCKNHGIEL